MRKTYHPILIDSIEAAGNITAQTFIGFDGNTAAVNARAMGVCLLDTAAGEMAGVGMIGVYLVTAGGALSAGDLVAVGTDGKAVKAASGAVPVGIAIDAATADGDVISVILGASTAAALTAASGGGGG